MRSSSRPSLSLTFVALLGAHCGGFFEPAGDHQGPAHVRGGHGRGGKMSECDPEDGSDAGTVTPHPNDTGTVDTGAVIPDAGVQGDAAVLDTEPTDQGAPECTTSADCPVGKQCNAGTCAACPDGVCPCDRDPDCPADQICNHRAGICEPPYVACDEVTDEAVCLERPECQAIYGGINCTDEGGGECTSSDPNCTCETFRFASCVDRP